MKTKILPTAKQVLGLILIFIFTVCSFSRSIAANITSSATGNWSSTATWTGGVVPGAADNVTIASGHTVTMDANATITSLTVTGTLQFTSTTTTYTMTFAAGSTITVNGTLNMGQLGAIQTGTTGTTTVTMGASANLQTSNVNGLGPIAGASLQTQGAGTFVLTSLETAGTVTYAGVSSLSFVVTDRNYNGLTLNGAGNYTWTLGADRTILGTLLVSSTSITLVGTQSISLAGNLNTQTTFNPGTSTLIMNGTGAQFINHNSSAINNFIINKPTGTMTYYTGLVCNGFLTVAAGTTFNPTTAFTVMGAFTNNGIMTQTGSTWTFGGSFTNNGTFNTTTAATFNGTAAQSIAGTSPVTFGSMTINNAAGVTLNQNTTVNTALNLTSGVLTLSNPLTLGNAATITRSCLGSLSAAPVFGTTVNLTYSNTAAGASSITPGSELPASSTVLNNFIVSNFTYNTTVNLASDITVNGALTLTGTVAFLNAGASNIVMKGAWSNGASASAFNGGTGTVTWNGTSTSIGGTYATAFNNLVFNVGSANTMTMSIAPIVNGTFTLTSGTVALGTIGFTAKGNVINNASATPFTGTTGVFQFAGSSPQSLTGSFATTFTRLTMNNSTGLTINANTTVTLGLVLISGNISTGANSLILSASTTTVARTSGHIVGNFTKALATGSAITKVFEIGTGADYAPISLTFASITTAGNLTATTIGTEHPNAATSGLDLTKDVNRYWTILNSGLVFTNYNATFTFVPTDVDALADPNVFEVRKYNSPTWTYTIVGTRTTTSTQATGLTTFGDYAVGTVIPVTPAAPTLVSPLNAATNQLILPTLTWNSVYGATSYGLTVATDPGFTNVVISQSGLATTSYTVVTPLSNSQIYYWHVTATNIAGTSAPSPDWNFTTIIAIPPAPALTSPVDGATGVSTTPLLTWNVATGAATYRVQISTDPAFATTLIDQSGIATNSYTVSPALGTSSLYYWRVNATNVGGTGPYSLVSSFTTLLTAPAVPTLLSPANLATNISTIPTLSWNPVLGATSYNLLVATDAGFSAIVVNQTGITGTSFNVTTPLASGQIHYWKVSATNIGGTSAYSTPWSFTTRTATTITSTKTGNWSDPTAWSTGYVPSLGDAVVIATGHVITVDANATITNLTVTGTLQFTNTTTAYTMTFVAGSTITVNGTLNMGQLGVLLTGSTGTTTITMGASANLQTSNVNGLGPVAGASLQTQGTGTFVLTSLSTAGTVIYAGVSSLSFVVTDRNYNNLTLNGAGNFTWTLAADRTILGTLLVSSTSITLVGTQSISLAGNLNTQTTFNPGTSTLIMNGTGAQFINHNSSAINNFIINKPTGTMTYYTGLVCNGFLTVAAGTTFNPTYPFTVVGAFTNNGVMTQTGSTWTFGGSFTNNGTFNTTTAATFNGTTAQSITGTSPVTFGSMTINNVAGVTLNQNTTVNTALNLTSGVLTLSNPLTLGNAATITRSCLGSLSGTPTFGTTVNLTYSNTAAGISTITTGSEIPASSTVLNNFTVSNFTYNTTVNLGSDITVNGTLTLTGTVAYLNAVSFNIVMKGAWSNGASASAFNGGTGTVTWNGTSTSIGGTYATAFNNLVFNVGSANTMTMSIVPTVNGVFTLTTGTVALGTVGFIAKGNVINNSSATPFTGTTGVFQFAGTSPQSLNGLFATTFTRLTMNNATGLTLGTNATVTLGLTLTSGNISTGANSLILSASTTTVTRTSGHVIGNFTKALATGSAVTKVFEIGTGADYAPVSVTFASITTAGNLTATTVGTDHPNIATSGLNPLRDVNRYWTMTNSGIVFTTYDIVLTFVAGDIDPGANTSSFLIKKFNSPVWSGTTTGTLTATSSQALGLNSFSDFAVGEIACTVPTLIVTNPVAVCSPATVDITAPAVTSGSTPGLTLTYWTDLAATNAYLTPTAATNGTYYIKGTTSAGCFAIQPVNVTINTTVFASVTIAADVNPICSGIPVNFTALPVNGGPAPSYQWYNGVTPVGTNSPTYSYTPANGDLISVVMTSNATPCLSGSPATSNTVTMVVNPVLAASVTIAADVNPICSGIPVNFTALPVNGGSAPSYQWYNGVTPVGTNSLTYSYTPANGDLISVVMTSNATPCLSGSPAPSNTVTMTVNPVLIASVTIAADVNPICSGIPVNFTALPVNGGSTPSYQWYNGVTPVGTDSPIYSYTPANGDVISVVMTSNAAPCLSGSPAISNSETVVVIPLVAASGSINGPVSFTPGTSGIAYSVGAIANATSYIWSYTGTGVTINGTGTNVTLDFALNATAGDIVVNGHNNCGNGLTATLSLISGTQLDITNLFLESLYNGGGTMRQAYDGATPKWPNGVADHIKVELHSAANYGNIIYSQPDVPLSTNGAASLIIPGNYKDSYYITIRHRNSIETTTATAISFAGTNVAQSFGTPADVFGGNLKPTVDLWYVIFAGDVDQDGGVGIYDMGRVENASNSFASGYLAEDVDGDGSVGIYDMGFIENNSNAFVGTTLPF